MTLVVHGATRKIDFFEDTVGQSPKGFEFGRTAKTGAPGKWGVQAEGANKFLPSDRPRQTNARFPTDRVIEMHRGRIV
jgi:hypothetical protein